MTLANNHINDYGETATKFTRNVLDKYGIGYFGINYGKDAFSRQVRSTVVQLHNFSIAVHEIRLSAVIFTKIRIREVRIFRCSDNML